MQADRAGWQIGMGRRSITPPLGGQMAGFDARKGVSNAVHDDLHARALVFDDGHTQVAFVSVEVIAVSAEFALPVRERIESATGIPASHIFLSATHTHCGPVTINHFFNQGQPLDQPYLQSLSDAIVASVSSAVEEKRPRTLKTGLVPCEGIAVNRRSADGLPVDPSAGVLLIENPDSSAAALAVMYACHTTVLGPDTLSITQDFPFYTLAKLKALLGDNIETLFFNGAEGDLSIGHKSGLSAVGIIESFRTFETAQRLGERLADAVIAGLPTLSLEDPTIEVVTRTIALPLKQYRPLATMTMEKHEALRQIEADPSAPDLLVKRQRYLFARIEEYYASLYEAAKPPVLGTEMSAILLGRTAIVTLPGEMFVKIALTLRAASPFARTIFLGLTNDYIGYVPDSGADAESGYEVIASRVTPSAGDLVIQEAEAMLSQVQTQAVDAEAAKV